jgi:micrococcal nuclease
MPRTILFLVVVLAALVAVKAIAPLILIAAIGLVFIAWKWPGPVDRLAQAQHLAVVPESIRATPMRFSGSVAAVSIGLVVLSTPIGASADEPTHTPTPEVTTAPATASPSPTVQPTVEPTVRPTPSPTPRATVAPTPSPTPTPAPGEAPTGPTERGTVVNVVDGDTIDVLVDGVEVRVRLIGMDTPEVHSGVEWLGPEASAAMSDLVAGREVVLEKDVSETDQYGRALRYVWVEGDDGWLLVNLELIKRGFASITTYPPDVKYVDALYVAAQGEAQAAGIGIWGAPPTPVPTTAPVAPLPAAPSNCDPSYPDVCFPIGSSDIDCGEISARRFTVLWSVPNPDPHGFDGDADGIGCES